MNESKATRYHRRRRRTGWLAGAAGFGTAALLVASGASRALADFLTAAFPASTAGCVMATVLFGLVMGSAVALVRLPFDAFREWTLERAYGLDRAPFSDWLHGHVRGLLISASMLIAAMLAVRATSLAGSAWWAVAAVGLWAGSLGWSLAAPVLLRVFGGLRPLQRPHVVDRLRELGARAGARLDVYEWRGGDDARRAHAALGGVGTTRRVILSDTLLETLTLDEVEVVVAHELAHHVHGDVWTSSLWRLAVLLAGFAAAAFVLAGVPPSFGDGRPSSLSALPIAGLAAYATALLLSPVGFALSRRHERRADRYALALTANPTAFLTSMRRLAANNLVEERPSALTRLFSSHPSIQERMASAAGLVAGSSLASSTPSTTPKKRSAAPR